MRSTTIRHAVGYAPLVSTPLDPALTAAWVAPVRTDPDVRRDFRKLLDGIAATDLTEAATHLRHFGGPVLMAWAAEDRYFTLDLGRRLADCFTDAEVAPIADCRTFVPLDQPEHLAEAITTLVAATSARRSA
ncbi:MAG: alpha/beta fold hydrolase [Iamia sp.]